MQRGSDRLSVHRDDEMKHELQGLLRSGHPTRSEEWHDPEPGADDDPQVGRRAAPGAASLETVRLELARTLTRGDFPATGKAVVSALRRHHAPDALIEAVAELPPKKTWQGVQDLAEALVGERD